MNFYTRKRRMPAIIIVSLIDIFVILLIFVIVTTTFKRAQPAVVIRLPESSSNEAVSEARQEKLVVLTVSGEGEISLDERPVAVDGLGVALKEIVAAKKPLALRADTQAPFGVIVRVLDALKEAGASGSLPAFTEIRKKGL